MQAEIPGEAIGAKIISENEVNLIAKGKRAIENRVKGNRELNQREREQWKIELREIGH